MVFAWFDLSNKEAFFVSEDIIPSKLITRSGLCILLNPLSGCGFPCATVTLPLLSDAHFLGILCIWGSQYGKNGLNYEFGVQSWHPVRVDSLRADLTGISLYSRMVDFGDELDLGCLERVVVCEVEVDSEATSHKRCGFRSLDVNVPDHDIILGGLNGDSWDWLSCKITKFLSKVIKLLGGLFLG